MPIGHNGVRIPQRESYPIFFLFFTNLHKCGQCPGLCITFSTILLCSGCCNLKLHVIIFSLIKTVRIPLCSSLARVIILYKLQGSINVKSLSNTGLFKMIVGVLTTCHTQYTWDSSTCIFLFNRTTLQVFVTYLTGALYVHHLWFYKHQHENRVRSKSVCSMSAVRRSTPS